MPVTVIADTSTLLHAPMFDTLEWSEAFGGESVVLVICAAVIDELDRLKDDPRHVARQSKARRLVSRLYECLDEVDDDLTATFRSGTYLRFSVPSDTDPIEQAGGDTRILFAARELASSGDRVVIMTSDLGMMLRARLRGIEAKRTPHEWLTNTGDSEAERLARQVDRLRNRLPDLRLDVAGVAVVSEPSVAEFDVARRIAEAVQKETTKLLANCAAQDDAVETLDDLPDRWHQAATLYLEDIEDAGLYQALTKHGVVVDLSLTLTNAGTAPARHIVLDLSCPDDGVVVGLDDVDEYYSAPDGSALPWSPPPARSPDSYMSTLSVAASVSPEARRLEWIEQTIRETQGPQPEGPFYDLMHRDFATEVALWQMRPSRRRQHTLLWFETERLSHHVPWPLPVLRVLLLPRYRNGFQVEYQVHCDELLEAQSRTLPVPLTDAGQG